MPITIIETDLDIVREPLAHPFGFKGGCFTEKWLCRVRLQSQSGKCGTGIGGLSVLWSDRAVFLIHTEVGGNLIMAAMLEKALTLARSRTFETPLDLLDNLVAPIHEFGQIITGNQELRKTFTLNALVALDNAAWTLYAQESGTADFDALLPAPCREPLSHRHTELAKVPMIGYGESMEQILELARSGYFIFKIKLGAPGEPEEMLVKDMERITQIHKALGEMTTSHTDDGKVRYYLDANCRYPHPDLMKRLLDHARRIGMTEQILILEEPFLETAGFDVRELGVRVAVDESYHDTEDLVRKMGLGYSAVALKPAGKTLSMALRMAAEAHSRRVPCLVADSGCVPILVQWNKNIAARLMPFPGLRTNLLESNGPQHYAHWRRLMDEHPCAGAPWLESRNGVWHLDDDFYEKSGGIFA